MAINFRFNNSARQLKPGSAILISFMDADYVGALGLGHPLNDFRGAEHPLDFPYVQFNF
jgi:hypothetical protein